MYDICAPCYGVFHLLHEVFDEECVFGAQGSISNHHFIGIVIEVFFLYFIFALACVFMCSINSFYFKFGSL